jgi:hypothetical protein
MCVHWQNERKERVCTLGKLKGIIVNTNERFFCLSLSTELNLSQMKSTLNYFNNLLMLGKRDLCYALFFRPRYTKSIHSLPKLFKPKQELLEGYF